jgi:hypothetical protein
MVFASARRRLTAFLTKLVDDAHATAILSIVDHEEQRAIQLELARESNGEWRVARLPRCPDGLWNH